MLVAGVQVIYLGSYSREKDGEVKPGRKEKIIQADLLEVGISVGSWEVEV